MADKRESTLPQQADINFDADYIRMVGNDEVSYKNDFTLVAETIVENYVITQNELSSLEDVLGL